MKEKAIHWQYGAIVFACLLLSAASIGMLSYFSALFLTPVTQALGISRSSLALHGTFSTVTTMLALPFTGRLYKRFAMRPLILLGAVLGAGAHLCYSTAVSVYGFYAGGILAGLAACLFGSVPITMLLSNWFVKKRGLVTGLAFTGSGLASSLLSPIVSELIGAAGWRDAYRFIAVMIFAAALLAVFLIRPAPQSVGLPPYGGETDREASPAGTGLTQRETLRHPAYWLLALAIFLVGALTMGTQQQLVAYWQAAGMNQTAAVQMYSVVLLAGVCGKVLVGHLFDSHSTAAAAALSCSIAAASFLSLMVCTQGYTALIPAVLFGLTTALQVIFPAYLTLKFFGARDSVSNVGLMTTILYMGVSAGTPASAFIYDLTGSYRIAWTGGILFSLAALAAILAADRLAKDAY